ncbi:MAG: hypothetical protein GY854_22845, partial [Deltaproteobacteria bacterium]|nr:hypothetical protein [Deltaproteobacteria bacterium]
MGTSARSLFARLDQQSLGQTLLILRTKKLDWFPSAFDDLAVPVSDSARESYDREKLIRVFEQAATLVALELDIDEVELMDLPKADVEALAGGIQAARSFEERIQPSRVTSVEDTIHALELMTMARDGGRTLSKEETKLWFDNIAGCEDVCQVPEHKGGWKDKMRYKFQKDLRRIALILVKALEQQPPQRDRIIEALSLTSWFFQVQTVERKVLVSQDLRIS